jgi:hypothetical protein
VEILPYVPDGAYLVGGTALAVHLGHRESRDLDFFLSRPGDLIALRDRLEARGDFLATTVESGTLNGSLGNARIQFLAAEDQRVLEPMKTVAGIEIAGITDLMAMKLKVIGDRGELRDYFDVMEIEKGTGLGAEEGLGLFVRRYEPRDPNSALAHVVRGLGYFDDVLDDPGLPVARDVIERYWRRRQPEISTSLDLDG